jgi:hypothetical protein
VWRGTVPSLLDRLFPRLAAAVALTPWIAPAVEPVIATIEPARIAGRARFTITITGERFAPETKVPLSGLPSTVVESTSSRLVASAELDNDTAKLPAGCGRKAWRS